MNYWQDRIAKAQAALTNKNTKQIEKQLKKYYGKSMEKVVNDFEKTYNKVLLATEEGKQPTPADLYKLDSYWQMQGKLRLELQKLGDKQISAMSKIFELQFFDIYYSFALETDAAFATLSLDAVRQMVNQIWVADGKSWSQRIWKNTELLADTLNEELLHCVATGKKTTELKKILQNRFNVSYSRADALVRTELSHIQTQAAQKRYEDYGIQEVMVWADEDERRCEVCGELHEKKYPVGAHMPIPAHPKCRCSIVPVVE